MFSDPDASWGHRSAVSTRKGGGCYGFKLHAAVCAVTGLPLARRVETAKASEIHSAAPLLDSIIGNGFAPKTCAMDKLYDITPVYEACVERGVQLVTPRHGTGSARQPKPLHCTHGLWTFAGADFKRKATEWRCPTGECVTRKSVWIEADRKNPLIPRESKGGATSTRSVPPSSESSDA